MGKHGEDGDQAVNIEDLKNKYREEEKRNLEAGKPLKRQKTFKDSIRRLLRKITHSKATPVPETSYYKYALPRWCWKLQ
jgi:hypothetical protein